MDLFAAANTDEYGLVEPLATSPLAVRMRPSTVAEVVGQDHLLTPGSPLLRLVNPGDSGQVAPSSLIFWGPPGTGKTTLAYLVARSGKRNFVELSAVTAGVKEVREVIALARQNLVSGQETVLFIDEVHRFSKTQQDALLPSVENRWVTLIAATTENPSFSVVSPLLSRSILLTLHPLTAAGITQIVQRALKAPQGLGDRFTLEEAALHSLVRLAGADGRRSLTLLEAAAGAAVGQGKTIIGTEEVQLAINEAAVRYDQDQHYDVASAFIKSMRGSDVDAALHYLARMLQAGEDPRFIARRLMILASEDIGMADPSALNQATAAAQAVALVGMPEARIILAQAVTYLALAPKSNAAYQAIERAIQDIKTGKIGQVPTHLRDAHYPGAKQLGHGQDYQYPHDLPDALARQQYLPEALADAQYYQPTTYGFEAKAGQRWARIRQFLRMR